jgi:hypothetical protein
LYVYAGNDPINNTDPNGQFWPVDFVRCLFGLSSLGNVQNRCEQKFNNACPPTCDPAATESCQQFYEQYGVDAPILSCIRQEDPGLQKTLDACLHLGIDFGFGAPKVPGL